MRIDNAGEYRTSNGQRVVVNTVFSGRAFGCIIDDGGFVKSSYWYCVDGSHPTQSDLRIVSEWVTVKQHDDDLRQQHEQTIELLRQRIDTAVAAMSQLREISTLCGQRAVMAHEVRGIRQSLQGNSPTNLEGS